MIINGNAGSHPFHQEERRVRTPKLVYAKSGVATGDCISGMSIDAKCAWMRKRQELIREQRQPALRLRGRRV